MRERDREIERAMARETLRERETEKRFVLRSVTSPCYSV